MKPKPSAADVFLECRECMTRPEGEPLCPTCGQNYRSAQALLDLLDKFEKVLRDRSRLDVFELVLLATVVVGAILFWQV
jgi:hypothetical protein